MAGRLTATEALRALQEFQSIDQDAFDILRLISELALDPNAQADSRDLLLRALDRRADFGNLSEVLDHLVITSGLSPYAAADRVVDLPTGAAIAYESHRPESLSESGVVFNRLQAEVYRRLYSGQNVILSAPTSFGKSYVVEALVASRKWKNIIVIVPTIALIDEVRRRLARYANEYTLVTHPTQLLSERNLVVATQERLTDLDLTSIRVDLFILDEFYKLNEQSRDSSRRDILNGILGDLYRSGAQFYLTGPNIDGLSEAVPEEFSAAFLSTRFRTVAVNYYEESVRNGESEEEALQRVTTQFPGPTLIYCQSKNRTREAATWLMRQRQSPAQPAALDLAAWAAETYDPDWTVARALAHGIGVHNAAVPRALAHAMVRLFNEGALTHLVCTSTLIEGVNTAAKNVIVLDSRIDRRPLDYFTYANISGRAGRSFRNFVGNVISFAPPPAKDDDVLVDVPVLSQSSNATLSTLLSIPADELSPRASDRLRPVFEQDWVDVDVLRQNRGISPEEQIAMAERITNLTPRERADLLWSGFPTSGQLQAASQYILDLTHPSARGRMNARMLNARLRVLEASRGSVPEQVESYWRSTRWMFSTRDDAVEEVLGFMRSWAGHQVPRKLTALQRIVNDVHGRMRQPRVNYRAYASQVEGFFLAPFLVALEEYGLPYQTALKLQQFGLRGSSLNEMLASLRIVARGPGVGILTDAERAMLSDTLSGLGPA